VTWIESNMLRVAKRAAENIVHRKGQGLKVIHRRSLHLVRFVTHLVCRASDRDSAMGTINGGPFFQP
jgi:hypothetical protein